MVTRFIDTIQRYITFVVNKNSKSKKVNIPPEDRLSRPCGGKGGFDDYVERWH